MKEEILGKEVEFLVGDPWDFVNEHGAGPYVGTIIKIGDDPEASGQAFLIKLKDYFLHNGIKCEFFTATARYVSPYDEIIEKLINKESVTCNFLRISTEKANSANPFSLGLSLKDEDIGIIGGLAYAGYYQAK